MLAIGDRVNVDVKGALKDASAPAGRVAFRFTLDMDRLSQDEVTSAQNSGEDISEFLLKHVHGWKDQRLVLEDDGSPAAFSPANFRLLLSIASLPVFIYRAWLNDIGAQEKN